MTISLSGLAGHIGEMVPSVGIIWFLPCWFLSCILSIHLEHPAWVTLSLPTCYLAALFSAILAVIGFGYEFASLVIVFDDANNFNENTLLLSIIYSSAALMMLMDLIAVSVLATYGTFI